jgi:hypothetical protein
MTRLPKGEVRERLDRRDAALDRHPRHSQRSAAQGALVVDLIPYPLAASRGRPTTSLSSMAVMRRMRHTRESPDLYL